MKCSNELCEVKTNELKFYGKDKMCSSCRKKKVSEYQKSSEAKSKRNFNKRKYKLEEYGITVEEYDRMLIEQNNKCKICNLVHTSIGKRFHVDHDHKTGKVRGLLCMNCNSLLGHAKDNIEILKSAISYLK